MSQVLNPKHILTKIVDTKFSWTKSTVDLKVSRNYLDTFIYLLPIGSLFSLQYVDSKVNINNNKIYFVWKTFYAVFVLLHTCPCTTESIFVCITSAFVTYYNRFLLEGVFSYSTNIIVNVKMNKTAKPRCQEKNLD